MQIEVVGADGCLGRAVCSALGLLHAEVVPVGAAADASVLAVPVEAWPMLVGDRAGQPTVGAATTQADVSDAAVTVPAAGWWGGLGTLLGAVAVAATEAPVDLHVAYGLPGGRRAFGRVSPSVRRDVARAAVAAGQARVFGADLDEPLAEGRRLAWFPKPVGPAHAAAVPGLELLAPLEVPTIRTWLAVGSTGAEFLQAVGRSGGDGRIGRMLSRRAATGGRGPGGSADVRWAVVVEVRDAAGGVVRAWANGTDPVAAAGGLLATAATLVAGPSGGTLTPGASVLDLGPADTILDTLADIDVVRWSVSRPEPSTR